LAQRIGDPALLVAAALANNRGFESSTGHVDIERVGVLQAALDATSEGDPQRARLLATLAVELTYHPDLGRRVALAEDAVAVARRAADGPALFDALVRPYPALMVPELADQRLQRILEAADMSKTIHDPIALFWMSAWLGIAMVERADVDGVERAFAGVDRIAHEVEQPSVRWASAWSSSWRALLTGDPDRAELRATEALQLGNDSGQPDAFLIYGLQLLCIRWHQGRVSEILPIIRGLAMNNESLPGWVAGLAFSEALEGDEASARKLVDGARSSNFGLPDDRVRLIGTCAWAEAAAELRDEASAAILYQQLLAWHDHIPISGHAVFHCVAQCLGRLASVLGKVDDAEAHLTEALEIHRRLRAPFFIAESELALGRLVACKSPDYSISLVEDAARLAARHGYLRIQRLAGEVRAGNADQTATTLGGESDNA
jgi:hypothetical protein